METLKVWQKLKIQKPCSYWQAGQEDARRRKGVEDRTSLKFTFESFSLHVNLSGFLLWRTEKRMHARINKPAPVRLILNHSAVCQIADHKNEMKQIICSA